METTAVIAAAQPTTKGEPPNIEGYLSAPQFGRRVNRTITTAWRWRQRGFGPPVTYIGKTPYYRIAAVEAWLLSLERPPKAKPARKPRRQRAARGNRSREAAHAAAK